MDLENLKKNWEASHSAFAATPAERNRLLRQSVTDDITFTSPTAEVHGFDELVKHMEEFRKAYPEAHFKTDQFLNHHGELLTDWTLLNKDGATTPTGSSYARYNAQERFTHIANFKDA